MATQNVFFHNADPIHVDNSPNPPRKEFGLLAAGNGVVALVPQANAVVPFNPNGTKIADVKFIVRQAAVGPGNQVLLRLVRWSAVAGPAIENPDTIASATSLDISTTQEVVAPAFDHVVDPAFFYALVAEAETGAEFYLGTVRYKGRA